MVLRKSRAFATGTNKNHISQIRLYISFCCYYKLRDIDPETETVCLYVEFLAENLASPKSVANYLSAVRFLHKWVGAPTNALDSFEVTLLLRACHMTMRHIPNQKRPITPDMIRELLAIAAVYVPHYTVFKCAVLFAFHGFFRISNITPRSPAEFNPAKHTCRGDIFEADPGLAVLLKWSKTNQDGQNSQLVPLPKTQDPGLCPVTAYKELTDLIPTQYRNQPLLSLPAPPSAPIVPVTQSWLAHNLATSLQIMGEDPKSFSFHSFRRAGATTAYQAGVNFAHIKTHGGWKSDAFWCYVTGVTTGHTQVTKQLALV